MAVTLGSDLSIINYLQLSDAFISFELSNWSKTGLRFSSRRRAAPAAGSGSGARGAAAAVTAHLACTDRDRLRINRKIS